MSNSLSAGQVTLLAAYAVAMAGGQLLFKAAAMREPDSSASSADRLAGLVFNGYFALALVLYAALTVFWVWILSFTPLSRAYPFVALAFALTPALASLVFGEAASFRLVVGTGLILCGLVFIAG